MGVEGGSDMLASMGQNVVFKGSGSVTIRKVGSFLKPALSVGNENMHL